MTIKTINRVAATILAVVSTAPANIPNTVTTVCCGVRRMILASRPSPHRQGELPADSSASPSAAAHAQTVSIDACRVFAQATGDNAHRTTTAMGRDANTAFRRIGAPALSCALTKARPDC